MQSVVEACLISSGSHVECIQTCYALLELIQNRSINKREQYFQMSKILLGTHLRSYKSHAAPKKQNRILPHLV